MPTVPGARVMLSNTNDTRVQKHPDNMYVETEKAWFYDASDGTGVDIAVATAGTPALLLHASAFTSDSIGDITVDATTGLFTIKHNGKYRLRFRKTGYRTYYFKSAYPSKAFWEEYDACLAGRIQAEFLGPLIEREIWLLASQGLLPQIPPMLLQAATEYRVWYDNPLSRMARAEKATGFMRALSQAAEYTKMTGDPEPLDHFDFDRAMPEILDINGSPVDWTRSPEDIAERRAQRAQRAQQQTMIEAAPAAAGLVKAIQP